MYDEPGAEESERNRKDNEEYWESKGVDRLGKFIIFRLIPAMFLGLGIVLWIVSRSP